MFLKTIDNSLNINEENLDGCVDPFQKTRRSSFLFSICNAYFSLLFIIIIIILSWMLQVAQVAAYKLNCPLEMIAIKPTAAFTNPNSKYDIMKP